MSDTAREFRRYRWLSAISDHLSPAASEIYRSLKDRFGEQAHLDRTSYMEFRTVHLRSPVDEETLRQWSVREIVRYCAAYRGPEESFDGPSREGLADALRDQVKRRPAEFAAGASEFTALGNVDPSKENPRYVASLFRGLDHWVRESRASTPDQDLSDVLQAVLSVPVTQLVEWVMARKPFMRGSFVPTWGWVQRDAADFLFAALERPFNLPPETVGSVISGNESGLVRALRSLQQAADPAPEEQADDPIQTCINSTRGDALHAAIAFQICWERWKRVDHGQVVGLHPIIADLLEECLRAERSPAVRCVFGWRLPHLFRIDPEWTAGHMREILPQGEIDELVWRGTWDAFVAFNPLYENLWEPLKTDYARASRLVGQRSFKRIGPGDPDEHLGAHVFLAWFAGFEAAEPILASFLLNADDGLKSDVVRFAASVLKDNVAGKGLGEPSPEWRILERFWRERTTQTGVLGAFSCGSKEGAAFVHWLPFVPASLPALMPLIEALASYLPPQDQTWEAVRLLEYLVGQSRSFPTEVARLLRAIAEVTWPLWLTTEQREAVVSALRLARHEHGGEELVSEIVSLLASRHQFEYRRALTD